VAFALMPVAFIMDALDGRIARWRFKSSPLGADLDSLADVISFGMAPAALAFAVGLRGGLDVLVLLYFVACGISRLARFNVTAAELSDGTGKVKYFEGTPIPTSLALVLVLAILTWLGRIQDNLLFGVVHLGPVVFHPLVLLYAASGSAMISKTLRIPKF
jgi:CDP-diacylglycerol--serine O-phosphatidyltransferase